MFCAGVVLPHPPLLVPDVAAGAAAELGALRTACDAALAEGLAERPDRVVLVGTGHWCGTPALGPAPTLAPFGMPGPPDGLPLALTVGNWLVDRSGWAGPREYRLVTPDAAPDACALLGTELAAVAARVLLVALGDGSACRSLSAPGHLDPRAEAFDAAVAAALATADTRALLALDVRLAADLLAGGRAPWQVLAGAARAPMAGRLHFCDAPYGVGYFVACWRPALLTFEPTDPTRGAC